LFFSYFSFSQGKKNLKKKKTNMPTCKLNKGTVYHQNDESTCFSQNLKDWWFELNPQKATFSLGRVQTNSYCDTSERDDVKWSDNFENLMRIWKSGAFKLLFKSSLDLSKAEQNLSSKYDCNQTEVFKKSCESSNIEDFEILKSLAIIRRKLPIRSQTSYGLQVEFRRQTNKKQMFTPCG
jgi:hypothetical protein